MSEERSTASADHYFAIVPEWVLYSDVSANAVRLYGTLRRFADQQGHAYPARKTLAERMKVSTATVDRAVIELVELGAIDVKRRPDPSGDWTSNSYFVRSTPKGVSSQVQIPLITGEETVSSPVMNEPEPFKPEKYPLTPKGGNPKLSKACNNHRRAKAYCAKCQQANEAPPIIPDWCGKCDPMGEDQPYSRMLTIVDAEGYERIGRCPECWPKKVSA